METSSLFRQGESLYEFKSYYVVWKRRWEQINQEKDEGLNRTM